jgi:TP901 family phage tail tape measure protein
VKLTVAATMDGFVRELDKGDTAYQRFKRSVVSGAKEVARGLHDQEAAAREVATPLLAVGAAATLGFGYAVKSAADFEQRMSSVQSLSHATAGEMDQLRGSALTAGAAIGYSATEAADAQIELVKAGVQASDIIGGALTGSLKLAAAGQIDVAQATEIASSTMTQFGKSGSDVTHIADLLAAGADKALGGVDQLGQGLKYLGPVAAANNVSLEETVGTMALLAQNAILGDQAGTSLRGVLSSLTSPSALAAKTMEEYGISVYDASGNFKGFSGVAEELRTKLGGLDLATRNQALGQIFGNEQITAATVLMKGGAKEVNTWTKAVDEQGFATEQAVGKLDNLNGDLTKFHAAMQTAAIVTGEAAQGPFRAFVQAGTDMLQTYSSAPEGIQTTVLVLTGLTAAVALSTGAMLIGVPKVVAFATALDTLATSKIPGVSRAAGGLQRAGRGIGSAFGAVGGFLTGPWGVALGIGAAALSSFNIAVESGKASQQELQKEISGTADAAELLQTAARRSDLSKFLVGDANDDLKELGKLLNDVTNDGAKDWLNLSLQQQQAKGSLVDLGDALSEVAAADAPAAAKAFKNLSDSQSLSIEQQGKLLDTMSSYKSELRDQASALGIADSQQNLLRLAMGDYQQAAKEAIQPTAENKAALQELESQADDSGKAIDELSKTIEGFGKTQLDANGAQRAFEQAVADSTEKLKENAGAVTDNASKFDLTTQKGRDASASLDDVARAALANSAAMIRNGESNDVARAAVQRGRDEVVKQAQKLGLSKTAAELYATSLGLIPENVNTNVTANTGAANANVDQYITKVKGVPNLVTTLFQVQGDSRAVDSILAKIRQARSEMSDLNGATSGNGRMGTFATGGAVYGPGTGTSDSIEALLSNGEHVITAAEVIAAGGHSAVYAWRRQLMQHRQGFAEGGAVTAPRYSSAAPTIVLQTGQVAAAPLVGEVTMQFPQGTSEQSAIDQLMFQLRTLDRGGR